MLRASIAISLLCSVCGCAYGPHGTSVDVSPGTVAENYLFVWIPLAAVVGIVAWVSKRKNKDD